MLKPQPSALQIFIWESKNNDLPIEENWKQNSGTKMSTKLWQRALNQSSVHLYGSFVTSSDQFGMEFAQEIRKALLDIKIDAVYCIQNVPHFAILEQSKFNRDEVIKAYAALWNQGVFTLLVVVTPDMAKMFSLAKSMVSKSADEFEKLCKVQEIETNQAISVFRDYVHSVESGRIWRENPTDFDYKERVDHVLLENLKFASKELKTAGLETDAAQAILIQAMFIAYLEDRGIITNEYFRNVSDNAVENLTELLISGNLSHLQNLFKQLKKDFNGDLLVAPCSFEDIEKPINVSKKSMQILADFRSGIVELNSGQMRLFGYNFRYIPIELISSVYDQFLTEDNESKQKTGAYYTPVSLVEISLSSLWQFMSDENKKDGVFLDPACGSGVFLVRCFQRLCEYYRTNSKTQDIPWSELRRMVHRLNGRDLNRNAVRIAVFSLYVAMLDETSTKNIRKLIEDDCILPELWNNTLVERDFFKESTDNFKVDICFGNPPWSRHSGLVNAALKWCKKNILEAPNNQIAWPFVWKAIKHLNQNGIIAFLLPSNDFLYNTEKSAAARNSLFMEVELKRIVDFSDFRHQLFEYSKQPTALLTFSQKTATNENYKFEFWMPKAEKNLKIVRFSEINPIDKAELRLSFAVKNELAFKQFAWMHEPERKLFAYLNRLRKLSTEIGSSETAANSDQTCSNAWGIGRGFQPPSTVYKNKPIPIELKQASQNRYIDVKSFKPFSITPDTLQEFSWEELNRLGYVEAYNGPRVVVTREIRPTTSRLCVDYAEDGFAIKGQILGIVNRMGNVGQTKLLAGLLSSRLATWFFFHSSGSFGVSRPMITQYELSRFPFPSPKDVSDEVQSSCAAEKIIQLIENQYNERKRSGTIYNLGKVDFFKEIDRLTYEFFCLTEEEITLIEDSVRYVIPSIHPSVNSKTLLWGEPDKSSRTKYANKLEFSLNEWCKDGVAVSVKTVGKCQDFAILKLSLCDATEDSHYEETDNLDFVENFVKLVKESNFENSKKDVYALKIFDEKDLYFVKPLQLRYWLESTAIADADAIVENLEESRIASIPLA